MSSNSPGNYERLQCLYSLRYGRGYCSLLITNAAYTIGRLWRCCLRCSTCHLASFVLHRDHREHVVVCTAVSAASLVTACRAETWLSLRKALHIASMAKRSKPAMACTLRLTADTSDCSRRSI